MSDDLKIFKPKLSNIDSINSTLNFVLSGDNEYGLDKSLVNAIRRILLTDIPTIGFNLTETGENSDLIMVTNNSSLHNEMLSHRIALIPLYLKPENFAFSINRATLSQMLSVNTTSSTSQSQGMKSFSLIAPRRAPSVKK